MHDFTTLNRAYMNNAVIIYNKMYNFATKNKNKSGYFKNELLLIVGRNARIQKKDAERLTFDIGGIYIRDRYCLLFTNLFYYFFVKIQLYFL